jgi:GT2 family glycosyltransferase
MITVGITTHNRPAALRRCVASLHLLGASIAEIVVADDHSNPPVSLDDLQPAAGPIPVRIIASAGYIHGRNRIVDGARTPFVLLLDDDAVLLSAEAVEAATLVLEADATVGGVAFAQANADGSPWSAGMQPGRSSVACVVPTFIGFAHLLRRDVFLRLGGYRERLVFYGEEKDYCLRLLDGGWRVVYLPDALVGHLPDPSGRNQSRYVRHAIRNDCLTSLYTEPLAMVLAGFPVRLWRYTRMAKGVTGGDPGGLRWILGEVATALPDALRHRKPVSWATVRTWRRLTRQPDPYTPAGRAA